MKPESIILEYKEELNEGVFKTISAFSNTKGGKIFIGVTNKGNVKGINISNKEFENFVNRVVNLLGIHPGMEIITLENKPIIKISILESNLPISYKGKYYKRVGNTTRLMQDDELRNFFIKGINWDGFSGNYTLDEINEESVRKFLRMAIYNGRLSSADEQDEVKNILERLKLIDSHKITNAAIILFGKDPQKYFINTVVRIGRFKDQSTIIGDRTIGGNLFDIVEEAEKTIKQFINVRYEIIDSFQRKDIWDYPLPAIREALFNAVIHRDYFKFNIQIQIKIFDDHIWFYNPGYLPEGMTIERLKTTHPSISRNPLIMNVFYLAGFVEEYGSGFGRISKALNKAGLDEPIISEDKTGFVLQFKKKEYPVEYPDIENLNERQIKAVDYLKYKKRISNKTYQEINKTSKNTSIRDLNDMIEKKLLIRIGDGRSLYYILKK